MTYIDGPPLAVKCVRKFGSALRGEVTHARARVCVCVHIPRADFWPRADTFDVHCWVWLQSRIRPLWKPRNWPQNYRGYRGGVNLFLALKLFLKSFYALMKVRSWIKYRTFQSALHMLIVDHINIDGPPFPVKCVRKFGSVLGGEVTYRSVHACVHCWQIPSWASPPSFFVRLEFISVRIDYPADFLKNFNQNFFNTKKSIFVISHNIVLY